MSRGADEPRRRSAQPVQSLFRACYELARSSRHTCVWAHLHRREVLVAASIALERPPLLVHRLLEPRRLVNGNPAVRQAAVDGREQLVVGDDRAVGEVPLPVAVQQLVHATLIHPLVENPRLDVLPPPQDIRRHELPHLLPRRIVTQLLILPLHHIHAHNLLHPRLRGHDLRERSLEPLVFELEHGPVDLSVQPAPVRVVVVEADRVAEELWGGGVSGGTTHTHRWHAPLAQNL